MMEKDCCQNSQTEQKKGFWSGLLYGVIPHSFCLVFIILSIIGATTATVFLKRLLILPYFFQILMGFSVLFATLSAIIYLKRLNFLSFEGLKKKWRYLLTLYGATILINLLFFLIIFPSLANFELKRNQPQVLSQNITLSSVTLAVDIPCPGHAPLVNSEIKKLPGVQGVIFKFPNLFEVQYNPEVITAQEILNLEIFKTFKVSLNEK